MILNSASVFLLRGGKKRQGIDRVLSIEEKKITISFSFLFSCSITDPLVFYGGEEAI